MFICDDVHLKYEMIRGQVAFNQSSRYCQVHLRLNNIERRERKINKEKNIVGMAKRRERWCSVANNTDKHFGKIK